MGGRSAAGERLSRGRPDVRGLFVCLPLRLHRSLLTAYRLPLTAYRSPLTTLYASWTFAWSARSGCTSFANSSNIGKSRLCAPSRWASRARDRHFTMRPQAPAARAAMLSGMTSDCKTGGVAGIHDDGQVSALPYQSHGVEAEGGGGWPARRFGFPVRRERRSGSPRRAHIPPPSTTSKVARLPLGKQYRFAAPAGRPAWGWEVLHSSARRSAACRQSAPPLALPPELSTLAPREPGALPRVGQVVAETLDPETLEVVGATCASLVGATPKHVPARPSDGGGRLQDHLLTRPSRGLRSALAIPRRSAFPGPTPHHRPFGVPAPIDQGNGRLVHPVRWGSGLGREAGAFGPGLWSSCPGR